ncbi:MAG: C-GCAxxG-C-C family protein [Bacilli bacterium]
MRASLEIKEKMREKFNSNKNIQPTCKTKHQDFLSADTIVRSPFAAHAPKLGIDKETALRISAPLGGGVGRMRQTCGAFLACAMLWGLKTHPVPIHWRLKNRSIKILNAWLKYSFPKTVPCLPRTLEACR